MHNLILQWGSGYRKICGQGILAKSECTGLSHGLQAKKSSQSLHVGER